MFRLLLFKCRLSTRTIASLNIFVEKYYSCYRDGTEEGKDLRSLASVYFIFWLIIIIIFFIPFSTSWILVATIAISLGTVTALVRPYKKTHMNIIDTLIIENYALLVLNVDKYMTLDDSNTPLALLYESIISILNFVPLLGLTVFIAYGLLKKIKSKLDLRFRIKQFTVISRSMKPTAAIVQQDLQDDLDDDNQELPDRMLHPQQYAVEMNGFENVNYIKAS